MQGSLFEGQSELTLSLVHERNHWIFYFSRMIKFANFEFIFAIRGPKFATVGEV